MPRKKKTPAEWTTEEAEKHLFPKKVVEEVHRMVQEQDNKEEKQPSQSDDSKE